MENKQGNNNLVQLAQELERQKTTKRDCIAPSDEIRTECHKMEDGNKTLFIHVPKKYFEGDIPSDTFGITNHTHSQISEKLKIPKGVYISIKNGTTRKLEGYSFKNLYKRTEKNKQLFKEICDLEVAISKLDKEKSTKNQEIEKIELTKVY